MRSNTSHDREYEIWVLINQVRDVMTKARDNELRPLGLNSQIQAGVLYHLHSCSRPLTIAEISLRLIRKSHTISALLDRMELNGLVRKIIKPGGKNRIRLEITEKGEQVYKRTKEMKVIREILADLNEEQSDNLISYLITLRIKAFINIGEKLQPPFP